MGMDICNYFLHNHKDVTDVKFLNWTEIVFVKFQDVAAAERFLGLTYVLFFGSDLTLNDVESFLKKKNVDQKDEVARVLLGKRFNDLTNAAKTAVPANGNGTNNGSQTMEVELSMLPAKQNDLRNMFISELHLAEGDVGQPSWETFRPEVFCETAGQVGGECHRVPRQEVERSTDQCRRGDSECPAGQQRGEEGGGAGEAGKRGE